jgi:hypothetical protein
MRATITVYGPQGSGKTRWLSQLKAALMGTAPIEAVEVTVFEGHSTKVGTFAYHSQQFDEFTIPAADAEGSDGVAGDRETWSVYWSPNGKYPVYSGTKLAATFERQFNAELFKKLKCTTSGQWQAIEAVFESKAFYFNGERPLFTGGPVSGNCKGGGGEIAEGAGVIPRGVYWCNVGGNFYDAITHHGQGAQFYRAWVARRREFPQSENLTLPFATDGKLSAAEAPAIHDDPFAEATVQAERDEARRDAVELRKERDEARREVDDLEKRLAGVTAYLHAATNAANTRML